jgi:threonine/homoserine/homoserine lactone efflux protein
MVSVLILAPRLRCIMPTMPWPELAALLAFATAIAFTPGPNTTLAAALAANHGLRHALRFVVGVPVGWGALLLGCALGLGALLEGLPLLRGAVKWAGLAYMLWLAWTLAGSATLAQAGATPARGLDIGFWQGVVLQFVNIKAWMAALLVSAGWIATAEGFWLRVAVVLPVMMAYGLASNLTYALIGSALRGWLAQGARLLWFNRALSLVLVATALWMARL